MTAQTTAELADPVASMLAMLTHESALVRHAALTIVREGNHALSVEDCLFIYETAGWHVTPRGTALRDQIERHYIATAVALYDNSIHELPDKAWQWATPQPRQWIDTYPPPRVLPEPQTWPTWFWALCGVGVGVVLAIVARG